MRFSRGHSGVLVSAVCLLSAQHAGAQVFDSSGSDYQPPPAERRDGFVLGLGLGLGLGSSAGYPNNLSEIGQPEFEESVTGVGVGQALWLGGALRDWFTFGLGLSARSAGEGDLVAQNGAFVIHVEGFPLWSAGGEWRDVGLLAELGAGSAIIADQDGKVLADGGAVSVFGVGAFYEPLTWWHLSFGPTLQYTFERSESLSSHMAVLGLRTVFYGVQP